MGRPDPGVGNEQVEPVKLDDVQDGPPSLPKIDETSPVQLPDQPGPRLLPKDEDVTLETLQRKVALAERLSALLEHRELKPELGPQVESGRAFLEDAKGALKDQDLSRANVLIDKCMVLLQDAEGSSQP